jgi:hypothetical protein
MINWPKDFPCPLIDGFGAEAYAAVLRTPFQGGNTRQRRIHRQLPHAMQLTWVFKQDDYGLVLNWMNIKAWDWFTIDLPGPLAGLKRVQTCAHIIRFISDLKSELIRGKEGYYWKVSVTAEWLPEQSDFGTHGSAFMTHDWVIAGSPRNASAPVWIIAGTPAAPNNAKVYVGGTPGAPAAFA